MDPEKKKKIVKKVRAAIASIRTRYALVTAFFLLLAMAMFYIGGRIVLVHFINDTERQVRDVGRRVSNLAYRHADDVRQAARRVLRHPKAATAGARTLLADCGQEFSLVAVFEADGTLTEGALQTVVEKKSVIRDLDGLGEYAEVVRSWVKSLRSSPTNALDHASTGIVRMEGRLHNVVLLSRGETCVMFGMPFAANTFLERERSVIAGMEVRIGPRMRHQTRQSGSRRAQASSERSRYGISPMFSEAMEFYSGGFWKLRNDPFEAVFAIRDIAGNAVTSVSVSLPKTFAGASRIAIWRLAFFIAIGGIFFVLPLFWTQNRILLNPLSKMTRAILDMRTDGTDCPRIEWKGRDEFAQLAESVNRMVETIAAKTVSLANSEASHQALIDGVPDALVVFDLQGRMVSITKQPEGVAPLPGFFPGEPPAAAVFGEEPIAEFRRIFDETVRGGVTGKVRLKVQRPLGLPDSVPTRHFELRLTRMGERFVLAIVRDVSAEVAEHKLRLAAEQRSLDVSKRESLTGLAAGIAHDMNNVLSVVLNAAEAEEADPSGDSAKTLMTIRDAVKRGSSMMRELMTFAGENRITLMRAKPQIVMEDIRHLVEHMVGDNIDLSIVEAEGVPDVDVDPNQFWKVLFNVIKNAGEAIGPAKPGRIELSARPFRMTAYAASRFVSEHSLAEGDGVLFRIEDDGPGIRPDILGRIFDPYVSSKSLGRGLGLATVRTIVEAHGGGIRVENVAGGGAVFSVFLPASRLAEEDSSAAPVASEEHLTGDVLIVDNEEFILKTTSRLLKVLKLTAHVAHDRRESLAVVRRYAGSLKAIILDANLGGIDTVRLLGAFRIAAPDVKIVVSSGSAEAEIREMFRTHPYDDFLAKPYTITELKGVIRS